MWSAIRKQFRTQGCEGAFGILLIAGGWLFGVALMCIVLGASGQGESYFELGTVIGGIVAIGYSLLVTGLSFYSSFQIEVGFGSTRKHFFVSFYLYALGMSLINGLMIFLLCRLEQGIYGILYPGLASEVKIMPVLVWLVPSLAVILPMAGISAAAFMMRFGKIAFWFCG